MTNLHTLVALSFIYFSIYTGSLNSHNEEDNTKQYPKIEKKEYSKPGSDGGNSKPK